MTNVFISHRKNDADEARRLVNEIRQVGHQVWFDEWQINVGDSIVERINEGLAGTTYLVLCYSSTALRPGWTASGCPLWSGNSPDAGSKFYRCC